MKNTNYFMKLMMIVIFMLPWFTYAQKAVMDKNGQLPISLKYENSNQPSVENFFEQYKQSYALSDKNKMELLRTQSDKIGNHHRFNQSYQGIEIIGAQYILHEKGGKVFQANGHLVQGIEMDVHPKIDEQTALNKALAEVGATKYMWEDAKNETFIKREQHDDHATFKPKGELKLTSGRLELKAENIKLVYRFDIYAEEPYSRYWIDVDAKTGEIVNKVSRIHTDDVPGTGASLYNGTVNMTVSDDDYAVPTGPGHFHLNTWNAYGGSGESWWVADPTLGTNGGYDNGWYNALDTDPISVTGTNPVLTFYHRYSVELPAGAPAPYDGWDGMNVRVSTDNGLTWNVLASPTPDYTNNSLYSFGEIHGEGFSIPGWTGAQTSWSLVTIDLTAFAGQSINIRFAFASDGGGSTVDMPELFSWQLDNIEVNSTDGNLFSNHGSETGMTTTEVFTGINIIPGNFRLREAGRSGVFTFDANNGNFASAIDFVDDDEHFDGTKNAVGTNAHWSTESTYDYFLDVHGRDSYDGAGSKILTYADYGYRYNNAFWDGQRAVYGSGDGYNYTSWAALDVVAHELTHGVTGTSSGLIYYGESGALNESFSDIFGNLVEFEEEGHPDDVGGTGSYRISEDNTIGNGLLGIRNMANPNELGDPDTYFGDYWASLTGSDNGGVHTNSGVQNFWFYLLAEGGSGTNDNGHAYNVTGIGTVDAAEIAYHNNTSYLTPSSNFLDARYGSIACAELLFGEGSQQALSTEAAWNAVGVHIPEDIKISMALNPTALYYVVPPDMLDSEQLEITNMGGVFADDLIWSIYDVDLLPPPSRPETISVDLNHLLADKARTYGVEYSEKQEVNNVDHIIGYSDRNTGVRTPSGPPIVISGHTHENKALMASTTLSHSNSQTIMDGNSIRCKYTDGETAQNSYWRSFKLSDFGIINPFNVTAIEVGIQSAVAGTGGQQAVSINLYRATGGPFPTGSGDLIATEDYLIPDQALTIVSLPISAFLLPDEELIVEVNVPDGYADGNHFLIGSNNLGQTAPSFISAVSCAINTITNLADLGYPNMHIVMNVVGTETPDCPWLSVSPGSGNTAIGTTDNITVTADATGLSSGTFECHLAVYSNDADYPEIAVPVTLVVGDGFLVYLKDSNGDPLAGGSLEYREGGGSGWQYASEISDGIFYVDTQKSKVGLQMTYGPQVLKVSGVPTNTDYTFQMEEVMVKLREGGELTDGGEVHYTSDGWHYIGVTGDNGTGLVKLDMLPNTYTFRMKYNGEKELKQRTISPAYNKITFHVEDLKSAELDRAEDFQLVAYPNPFNGNTTIAFSLEEASKVEISVYDQTGRLIEVLHDGQQAEGNHKINWNAKNVNTGLYIIRLSTQGKVVHKNIVKM